MFEARKYYKHLANTDVALGVLKVLGSSDTGISLLVNWWNVVKSHPPFEIRMQTVLIKPEQLSNWKELPDLKELQRAGKILG